MKLVYSLCVLFLICGVSIAQPTLEPCAFCTMVVTSLQNVLQKETNPETIFQQLDKICGAVTQFVPQDKCTSFVHLYGRYIVKAINNANSIIQPTYLCTDILGFCPKSEDGPFYTPLLPVVLEDQSIRYSVVENDFKPNSVFYYKVFLGEPMFSSGATVMSATLADILSSSISLEVSGQENTLPCFSNASCEVNIFEPGLDVWYYFTVTVTDVSAPQNQFSLTVLEFNSPIIGEGSDWFKHREGHAHFIPIFPFVVAFVALVCCCCCMRRRRAHKKQQQQLQHLRELTVDLQAPEQQQQGYFYYPAQNVMYPYPQQAYIPMVSVSAPPATNEAMGTN